MTYFELSDGNQQGEVRADVEATFEPALLLKGIEPILDIVITTLKSTLAMRLNVRVERLEVSQDRVRVTILFGISNQNDLSLEDRSRISVNFVFYLFALVDQVITLKQAPFPDTYKYFINLPQTLAAEYGWD